MGLAERHLPPGRAPGGLTQRYNRKRRRGIVFVACVVIAAAAVVVAGIAAGPSARLAVVLACVGASSLSFAAYTTLRAGRPRWARDLTVEVEPIEIRRGGELTATVSITQPAKPGLRLELTLCCRQLFEVERRTTAGNWAGPGGLRYHVREDRVAFEQVHELDLRNPESTVKLSVPADGQLSDEGEQTCWAWAVDFRSHGTFGLRRASGVPIWVTAGQPDAP